MRRAKSLEMTLLLGKIDGTRRREQQDETWLDGVTDLMDISLSKLQEIVKYREAWHAASMGLQRLVHNLAPEQQEQQQKRQITVLYTWNSYTVLWVICTSV